MQEFKVIGGYKVFETSPGYMSPRGGRREGGREGKGPSNDGNDG